MSPLRILLVEVGSGAHGTGLPGHEDHDETAVEVEDPSQVFMLGWEQRNRMERTAPEGTKSQPHDTDRQVYSLRSFIKLATAGNPSILMCLWSPLIECTLLGNELRDLAPAFVGRHVVATHRGYMRQQGLRLLGLAGNQGHGPHRPELVAAHGYDTKYAMHAARLGMQCDELLATGKLQLPMRGEGAEWLRALRRGEIPFDEWWTRCLALDRKMEAWEGYGRLPARADGERIAAWTTHAHFTAWNR